MLGRYLIFSNWFNPSRGKVKASAFLPPRDLKLSVFKIFNLSEDNIWEIGKKVIEALKEKRTLYGIAEIKAIEVLNNSLTINIDNKPLYHANIVGWPKDKSERKLIAIKLANNATLKLLK